MRLTVLVFFIVLLFSSCETETLVPDSKVSVAFTNVKFGSDSQQKMDIYLPAGRMANATKTIVIIHGGGWSGGDKSEMTTIVDSLKRRLPNYAFINLNYRLAANSSVNVFPSQELDVKAAIEFYLSKSSDYEISKDLIVFGGSAGAHLALLHSYKNDPDHRVKAVIDFFGPTDLVALWNEGFLPQLALMTVTGKTFTEDPAIYTQSSPVNFIRSTSPPTIAFHGGTDFVVSPAQSTILINKLNSMGIANQLVVYPNDGHGFSEANNSDALNKTLSFISKQVK
jgi:acetyl esterase/lipase